MCKRAGDPSDGRSLCPRSVESRHLGRCLDYLPSRHSWRASLGGCGVVVLVLARRRWCRLVPLSVQELVSARHQSCSGIAAWRRPNARLDDADSSVLALRSLAPWKAWKAWFQDVNHAWHLPQPPFELQHHETVAHDRKRRWTRARLANATTHGGLESQPCKGLHIPS